MANSMASALALDKGVSGGLAVLREKMKEMADEIKAQESRYLNAIKGRDEARHRYARCMQKLKGIKEQILDVEDETRKKNEKFKMTIKRLEEKEGYIVMARVFNKGIETVEPEKLHVLTEKLQVARAEHMQQRKKYQAAKDRCIELEQRVEFKENKLKEAERREEQVRVSHEYRVKEYEIKKQRVNRSVYGSEAVEEKMSASEELLENATARLSIATRTVTALEGRIAAAEDALAKYKSQRLSMESTLRELLSSAVNMSKKKENGGHTSQHKVNATH